MWESKYWCEEAVTDQESGELGGELCAEEERKNLKRKLRSEEGDADVYPISIGMGVKGMYIA